MNKKIKKIIIAIAGLSATFITLFAFLSGIHDIPSISFKRDFKTNGSNGEWLFDKYIEIRVPQEVRGLRRGSDPYEIKIELINRTSQVMYINRMRVVRYSDEYNRSSEPIFEGIHASPFYMHPNDKKEFISHGNQILPDNIKLFIYHNLADKPSIFNIDVGGKELPQRTPKKFSEKAYASMGMDGLIAINFASKELEKDINNFYFFTAVPAHNIIFFDEESLFKVNKVISWHITLATGDNTLYHFTVSEESVNKSEPTKSSISIHPIPLPKIGNIEALNIASEAKKIAGDWTDLKLIGGRREESWTCCWLLPYLGSDGKPIIVDAINGDFVRMKIVREGPTFLHDVAYFTKIK